MSDDIEKFERLAGEVLDHQEPDVEVFGGDWRDMALTLRDRERRLAKALRTAARWLEKQDRDEAEDE